MKTPEQYAALAVGKWAIESARSERRYPDADALARIVADAIREAVREATADPDADRQMAAEELRALAAEFRLMLTDEAAPHRADLTNMLGEFCDWLTMPPLERKFVQSLLRDRADETTICAFADWLEDNGRNAEGRRVRLLRPQAGDVLVLWVDTAEEQQAAVARLQETFLVEGGPNWLVVRGSQDVQRFDPEGMRAAGWVRVEETYHPSPSGSGGGGEP